MEIQIDLLESYHRRIASAVDSFEALSLIRSVPVPGALPDAVTGVMTSTEKSGTTGGLQRLCRWWASAMIVRDRILEWGEEDVSYFFILYIFLFELERSELMCIYYSYLSVVSSFWRCGVT